MSKISTAALLCLLVLTGCRGCSQPEDHAAPFSFPDGAEKAAELAWQPWSLDVANESNISGKPVLISVSDPLCYWCAIFDRTTLANDRVAEILREKFILVRVEQERQPHVAARLEAGLPAIAAFQPKGNQVWFTNYLQPTPFNQGLYKVLRDELLTISNPGERRYRPRRAMPSADTVEQLANALPASFRYTEKTYSGDKNLLALPDLRFDVAVGGDANWREARDRVQMHLSAVMKHLRDPAGGFATGTFSEGWQAINPVKYAHEQAEFAALIMQLQHTGWADELADFGRYREEAVKSIAWLERELWKGGTLLPGKVGAPGQFVRGEKAPAPAYVVHARTDIGGATAAALAEAGRVGQRPEWIRLAQKIGDVFFSARTPEKLFWHVPAMKSAPNELGDAAAMLDAAVSLYQATGEERYLHEAQAIAFSLERLSTPEGYFVDTTTGADAMFPPEPLPAPNMRAASALWRLGGILGNEAFRTRARMVVMAFSGSRETLERNVGDYGVLLYQMTGPTGRLELPAAWISNPAAAPLFGNPSRRFYLFWTDRAKARICEGEVCSPEWASPSEVEASLGGYLASTKLPN